MKHVLIILILAPVMSWAKVSNFNDLIEENAQAQKELQQNLEVRKGQTREAVQAAPVQRSEQKIVLESATYHAPTGDKALKFKKEIKDNRPSSKKEMDRLAEEISSADREF